MDQIDLTKNEELQKALQEFEEESAKEEEEMKPVEKIPETSKLANWLVEHSRGLIKDEQQAQYVLLAFCVISLIISGINFFSGGPDSGPPPSQDFIESAGSPRDFLP